MQETAWAAGAPPRTPLGELIALTQTPLADGEGASCPSQEPHPALGLSGLACPRPLIFKPSPNYNPSYGLD